MKKVILYIAMSLDGYIADKNGGVSWLMGDGSDPETPGSYPSFLETIDTILLGYKTYHQIVTELFPENWVYSGKQTYVFTHKSLPPRDEIVFTRQTPASLMKDLIHGQGKNIWVCGGAEIVNQLISCRLIDKYCISIIPTILGGGIPLFKEQSSIELELLATRCYNGIVDLIYRPRY